MKKDSQTQPGEQPAEQSQPQSVPIGETGDTTNLFKVITRRLLLQTQALAAIDSSILICDSGQPDAPIIYANPGFTRLTGYTQEEVIGKNCRFLQGPDTDPAAVDQVRQAVKEARPCRVTFLNYKKDGTPFWNSFALSIMNRGPKSQKSANPANASFYFVGVQTDVTDCIMGQLRAHEEKVRAHIEKARADVEKERLRRERLEEILASTARERSLLKEVVYSVTEGKLRLCDSDEELPQPCAELAFPITISDSSLLCEVRRQVREAAQEGAFPMERWYALMGGASEAAMNALLYGAESATVHVTVCDPTTSRIQIWIRDTGHGIPWESLPRATLMQGHSNAGTLGHGFWLMLQGCDRLWLLTGPSGTTVVMEQERDPPEPAWLTEKM